MAKANSVVDVNEVVPVNQFVATLGGFSSEINQSAGMLVSVEKLEGDVADTKAGLSSILWGVLVSQGEPVLLGWHDAVRLSWGDAYRSARGGSLSDEAVNTAWFRVMKLLSDDYGYTKPKAETKGAEGKAQARAKQAELLAAYEAVPVADLKAKAKALYNQAGDGDKEAKKQADTIVKAIEAKTKAVEKASMSELKALRSEIVALVKQVTNVDVLADVASMLSDAVE